MPNREKVLKALEHHKKTAVCNGCPYAEDSDTTQGYCPVYDDAITLLSEQEPVKPIIRGGFYLAECGYCNEIISLYCVYCPNCGRKVKWDADD